jgi:hypothetical protein
VGDSDDQLQLEVWRIEGVNAGGVGMGRLSAAGRLNTAKPMSSRALFGIRNAN